MPDPSPTPSTRPRRSYVLPVLLSLAVLLGLGSWLWIAGGRPYTPASTPRASLDDSPAQWVDEQQCATCHAPQARAWKGSHHQLALQEASASTVKGDFNDARFEDGAGATRFFQRDGGFWVNTAGADGQQGDYRVAWVIGVEPLQQVLLAFPDGRYQALDIAWDVQRQAWFRLPAGQGVDSRADSHWAQPGQNANLQCIDCHTSGFQKHYDAATDRYASQWQSPGVGCQACHGPASRHLEWARFSGLHAQAGFSLDLSRASSRLQVESCARCHARRTPLGEGYQVQDRFMDDYLPAALTRELYELNGHFKEQVYEYGAFTQSRMYARGLSCTTCHDPHAGTLKVEGDGLCTQCHNPEGRSRVAGIDDRGLRARDYSSPDHHHHRSGEAGSRCVDCHMPSRTLQGNDLRHDHRFSLPDPAHALKLGTSDACQACHANLPNETLVGEFERWYGRTQAGAPRYDESLALVRQGKPGASRALFQQLERADLPAIRRATLLAELPAYPSERALKVAANDLNHAAPQVREAAIRAVSALLPPEQRRDLLGPLLSDRVRAVRIAAARDLLGMRTTGLGNYQRAWSQAIGEYEAALSSQAERPEVQLALAALQQADGRADQVEGRLRTLLARNPDYLPGTVALAQWLDANQRDDEALALLDQALARHPEAGALHHARGLALLRRGDRSGALQALEHAVRLEPGNPGYGYALATLLHDAGRLEEACRRLELVLESQPAHREARLALIAYWREAGQIQRVQALLAELEQLNPDDPALRRE